MHAAGAGRFGEAVVCVVLMLREIILPVPDQGGRNRLGADMHQPPLIQFIVGNLQLAPVEGIQDILRPRNQQPHDRALLIGDCFQDDIRLCPFQEHSLAAGPQRTHPVELRSGVIERRNAEEAVASPCVVMNRLHLSRLIQTQMFVQNCLGKSGGPGRKIDRAEIIIRQLDSGFGTWIIRDQLIIALGEFRTVVPDIDQCSAKNQFIQIHLETGDKFRAEKERRNIREVRAVRDLIRGIAEIERNRDRSGFQNTEIDREPFQAVEHQNRDTVTLLDPAGDQHVRDAVCLLIKNLPGNLVAEGMRLRLLDQLKFLKGYLSGILHARVQLHQGNFISVFSCVANQ